MPSDTVLIVTAVIAFLGTVFNGIMTYFMAKMSAQTKAVHTLVNSARGTMLNNAVIMLRRIAQLTEGTPGHKEDVITLELAQKAFNEHEAEQKKLDK